MKAGRPWLISLIFFAGLLLQSCDAPVSPENSDKIETEVAIQHIDELWLYDQQRSLPQRATPLKSTYPGTEKIINLLNESDTLPINLVLLKTSADTLFLSVEGSEHFSRMGSTGADAFISLSVFALTEDPEINYVHLNFPPVDHAMPGLYDRAYYLERYREFVKNNPDL